MNSRFVCVLTALCLASQLLRPACAAQADRFTEIRELIRTTMQETGAPSVAVAISQRGRIVWEEGFGWANKEARVPATEHTMYSLASISKPITATGLMTLVQAKRVDLNAPINDYLGPAKLVNRVDPAQSASVRQVANHSSGLPTYYQFFFADEPNAVPSMDTTIARHGQAMWLPGERFKYSNLGYGVLGEVVARVSGQSFAGFMRQQVFLPLGLTHMSVGLEPTQRAFEAIRYDDSGAPLPDYATDHPGASDVYASAHDLVRFGMFHLKTHLRDQKQILSDATIDDMQRLSFPNADQRAYGIGWNVRESLNGQRMVEHGGNMPGVKTVLIIIPAEQIAVVVLTNGELGTPRPIAHAMLQVLLPKWAPPEDETERKERPPFSPTPALLGKWQGRLQTYDLDLPVSMDVLADGNIHVQLGNQLQTLVNQPRFSDGFLRGRMLGTGRTGETGRAVDDVTLLLKLRGAVLNGEVTFSATGKRSGATAAWMELKKDGAK
ncbi:serine hydrolase domain-containing protein [Steroidobacter sp.]|uniref:serine hydrolase domain-containing protein n=1 Tax=Steroidobacter sp. TaxID=1978227 RepID=UPI001A636B57|nr:serine hydrolase domain-containing protein [Steroidobacter sp.]MBL8265377.1 beta-lactamase family protein [Steroidobacter sp.]